MKKGLIKELISLAIFFIVMPLLGYLSLTLYSDFGLSNNKVIQVVILTIIVAINVIAMYGLNFVIKKVPRIYYIINGLIAIIIICFVTFYYITYQGTICSGDSYECVNLINTVSNLKFYMGYSISFTIIYIMMFNIESKMRKPVDFSIEKK